MSCSWFVGGEGSRGLSWAFSSWSPPVEPGTCTHPAGTAVSSPPGRRTSATHAPEAQRYDLNPMMYNMLCKKPSETVKR